MNRRFFILIKCVMPQLRLPVLFLPPAGNVLAEAVLAEFVFELD